MKQRLHGKSGLLVLTSFVLVFSSIGAHAVIDDDAHIIYVRKGNCSEGGVELNNCFKNVYFAQEWIKDVHNAQPSPKALLVDIGPGYYLSGFECDAMTNITLRGSGPNSTILGQADPSVSPDTYNGYGIRATGCGNFHVQDMSLKAGWGVSWDGGGSSTWTNVNVEGGTYGWRESCSTVTNRPKHYWFNSRITGVHDTKVAYSVACSENWFFGTEVTNRSEGFAGGIRGIQARANVGEIYLDHVPEVHLYGSAVRVVVPDGADLTSVSPASSGDGAGIYAIGAGLQAKIHVHGTGIDVIGNTLANDVAALVVADGGSIHATQSSFVLNTGVGGTTHRIKNDGGIVKAPYQWEKEVLSMPLQTEDGTDTTIEMVCSGGSNCQPHMMVYSSNCSANGPWFDMVTGNCR